MKDVLIVNLTRMGDLVQTTPVMAGLKEKYPEVRITLLVNSAFSEICELIPFLDRVFIFEMDQILNELNRINLVEAYRYVESALVQINETRYDLAINFTHTPSSAILMSLINAEEVRGICIDEEGYTIKVHPWIRYFFNLLPGRDFNPFHLCDVYLKAGEAIPQKKGLHLIVPEESRNWAAHALGEKGVQPGDLVIGLQLGASAEDKRWPVASFAQLAERLVVKFGAKIILTGSAKESCYGEEFRQLCKTPVLNFIGKTDLKKLSALLERCDLLVSNDTGPLHVATAVGTTTLNISLASVYFKETGPYGEAHYVIQADIPCCPCTFGRTCTEMICKDLVSVDAVYKAVEKILTGKKADGINDSPTWENVQLYSSFFDEDGFIQYRPFIKRPLKKEDLFGLVYRKTWPLILDKASNMQCAQMLNDLAQKLSEWYVTSPEHLKEVIGDEVIALEMLQNYASVALSKVDLVKKEAEKQNPDISWIKETWKTVPVIDREIETIGHTYPALKPLTVLFRYGKESLEGKDLASLGAATASLYKDLIFHSSTMMDILKQLPVLAQQSREITGQEITLTREAKLTEAQI